LRLAAATRRDTSGPSAKASRRSGKRSMERERKWRCDESSPAWHRSRLCR
jgi:hypothetical protein